MPAAMHSKTVLGLLLLLAVGVGLQLSGNLTDQAVEVIKWVGGSFMAVRVTANAAEGFLKK